MMRALGMILIGLLFWACGDDEEEPGTTTETPSTATRTATRSPAGTASPSGGACEANLEVAPIGDGLTWEEILPPTVPAPPGWEVQAGEGEAPFLEVSREGEFAGFVELLQLLLPDGFDPEDGIGSLAAFAEELYEGVEADRQAANGESYELEGEEPEEVPFGEFCGIRYGFTGTQDAAVLDRLVGFATFDRGSLFLVVASYDAGIAEEQGFRDAPDVDEYAPFLEDLVERLRMPPE